MFIHSLAARQSASVFLGRRIGSYRLHSLVHPGWDGMDVLAQILDDRLPVGASCQVAEDTIDNCLQIGALVAKPMKGLDHPHCRPARPKSGLRRNALEVQD